MQDTVAAAEQTRQFTEGWRTSAAAAHLSEAFQEQVLAAAKPEKWPPEPSTQNRAQRRRSSGKNKRGAYKR